ncbi:fumarylacetoacetate hydrolase family protein [Robiginitomaculum antarcticum]|uniref:fumarylacetoacetate hydrolase family protein n=1 Tax=Robiginitomaculum antarcticum TaxID=437507 RepID=UPI0003687D64|nr:fumarylacetoacetate hydrolase family protein [Robiginitomaculum antarcticum]
MKLATLKNETRDGQLVVVSRDLKRAADVTDIAPTLQAALDDWETVAPQLAARFELLNAGKVDGDMAFDQEHCESPLPRAYQWLDGSAYLNHVELVRKARGAEVPESFYEDPLMYQGASDTFIGPRDDIEAITEDHGIDMEAELTIITDDVPMGVTPKQAAKHIKLIMLVNDVSLRGLIPNELRKGFGFVNGKASSAFSPVAITPDELGKAWGEGTIDLDLKVDYNGKPFGKANVKNDMTFDMYRLVSHAAKTRHLAAGTIIGSGTVSNKFEGGEGKKIEDGGVGYSCIAEIRMIEKIQTGEFKTPFMQFGDAVGIEMDDANGKSIFGRIENTVVKYDPPKG